MMKKVISIALILLFLTSGLPPLAHAMENRIDVTNDKELIYAYLKAVNDKDYAAYLDMLGGEFKSVMEPVLSLLIHDKMGVGAIKSINLKTFEVMADLSDTEYSETEEIQPQYMNGARHRLKNYLIKCEMEVYQDNAYYFNGVNYLSITCGTIDGAKKILDNRLPLPDVVAEYEKDRTLVKDYFNIRFTEDRGGFYISDRFSEEFKEVANYSGTMPTSINVLRVTKNRVDNVNFKQYCRVVMVCEEGYENRQTDYKKAFAIAIKHFGWFRYLKPRPDPAYHIRDDNQDQVYNPELRSPSNYPTCDSAMLSTWNTIMVNSDKQLFKPFYYNEGPDADLGTTQYQGTMYEYEVWKSLVPNGMNYINVLKYYYSNCRGTSVGQIRVCSNHTGSYTNITATTHKVNSCTTCKVNIVESHSFRLQGNQQICTKCGHSVIVMEIQPPIFMRNALSVQK
ncbi:MAG: hypothetical protein U0M20_01755 [Christensenellales bacterium]|nr:hypothetical protein [Christensenellales bacterium]